MIHTEMNEAVEEKMVGPVADLCIKINKALSYAKPCVVAIPRDMRDDLKGTSLRTPHLWADITLVLLDKHGELVRRPDGSYGHFMYLSSEPDKVTQHSEYMENTYRVAGTLTSYTSYLVKELDTGEIQINATILSVPDECDEPEYEDNPLDDFPTFMKKTQPTAQSLKTRRKTGASNVQSIFKHMEAGVAEEVTKQLSENRDLPMFAMLDPSVEYVALDTPRIKRRWWSSGDFLKQVAVKGKRKTESRGEAHERVLQDDHGIDIVVIPMTRFLDRKNPPTVKELTNGSYLCLQVKGAPQSHKYRSVFCEVKTHLAEANEIVDSGLSKTSAQWTGYVLTSGLTAWLPSSEYKRLAYDTNKEPSPSGKVREGYDKTSLGMPVECRAVFEHPSLCATVLPIRYAKAFNQISYCAVEEYYPKGKAPALCMSLKRGDFFWLKDYQNLAQDWNLDEYKSFLSGRLTADRITGQKEALTEG